MDDVGIIKSGYYFLNGKISKLLREGSKVLDVTYDENEKTYLIKAQFSPESLRREKEDEWKSDYERLKRMEKRIKTYPDLHKAVRAAMKREDNKIDLYLNQHERSSQENAQQSRQV